MKKPIGWKKFHSSRETLNNPPGSTEEGKRALRKARERRKMRRRKLRGWS